MFQQRLAVRPRKQSEGLQPAADGRARWEVIVVDDQPDICDLVRTALEATGRYRVTAVATGEAVLNALEDAPPALLIVDAVLPGIQGIELAARAVDHDVPVLLMTGEPSMDDRLDRFGWPYLRKPFRLRELLRDVAQAIADSHENMRMIRKSLAGLSQAEVPPQRQRARTRPAASQAGEAADYPRFPK